MREIVVDTETTGLDPAAGHRIVEIGCIELLNHLPTGRTFQCYLNPQRSIPNDAFGVHGLSATFLADKPRFGEIVEALFEFLADSPLVIHNAGFDLGFINAELRRLGRDEIALERTIDTVGLARRKYPGAPASLDALCRRYQIDLSDRMIHGALKDAQLLARVYLELRGGRQPGLLLASASTRRLPGIEPATWVAKLIHPSAHEEAAHRAFIEAMPDALWRKVLTPAEEPRDLAQEVAVAG
jgi:DNA polymerase-3 subunit epsilon